MRLGYVILHVADVAAAVAFYESAFGLVRRFVDESGQYAEMETGATALAFVATRLAAANGLPAHPAGVAPFGMEIALVADDVAAAFDRAVAAGAEAVLAPAAKPWGQVIAYVRDPDGGLIELCSPVGAG